MRSDHLADYLWAFGECCEDDPERFLGPTCNAWAALSDQPDKEGSPSPRSDLAAHELRWAFHKWPPLAAIDYFIQRSSQDDLKFPITHMLHGVDHPTAVLFVVHELVEIRRRLEGTGSFSPFAMMADDYWRRSQEDDGRPMSKVSRDLLLGLWRDKSNDIHLRAQAFSFWAATQDVDDIEVLRKTDSSDDLADKILKRRLISGDHQAIPAMIEKLADDEDGWWWHYGRNVSSPELTNALDEHLKRRGVRANRTWGESFGPDWHTHKMIMRLPTEEAERLLLKHWAHLRFGSHFVQTALYVSTPHLLESARIAISECPEPAKLFEHLSQHYGIKSKDHPGLKNEGQVIALAPYLDFVPPMDIGALWEACNDHGWFATRRNLLDGHLQPPYLQYKWDRDKIPSELDKMVAENRQYWIVYWIDRFLNTGVLWDEIFAAMTTWLDQRRTLEALQLIASAVVHRGTREDLKALKISEGMPETIVRQLITDTEFAVRRRSIR